MPRGEFSGEHFHDTTGGRVHPGYALQATLGEGGSAEVYSAHDLRRNDTVAVKIFSPQWRYKKPLRELFEREGNLSTEILRHPNILQGLAYGLGATARKGFEFYSRPYITLPLADYSLKQKLENGPLPMGEALSTTLQLADALAYAHEFTVHRDLKPANVLYRSGTPMISDFGIAVNPHSADSENISHQHPIGTLAYMAPEQHDGQASIQTDIRSVAIMLFEMLTGERPMRDAFSTPRAFTHVEGLRMNAILAHIEPVLMKAFAKEPKYRQTSMLEFKDQILTAYEKGIREEKTRPDSIFTDENDTLPLANYPQLGTLLITEVVPKRTRRPRSGTQKYQEFVDLHLTDHHFHDHLDKEEQWRRQEKEMQQRLHPGIPTLLKPLFFRHIANSPLYDYATYPFDTTVETLNEDESVATVIERVVETLSVNEYVDHAAFIAQELTDFKPELAERLIGRLFEQGHHVAGAFAASRLTPYRPEIVKHLYLQHAEQQNDLVNATLLAALAPYDTEARQKLTTLKDKRAYSDANHLLSWPGWDSITPLLNSIEESNNHMLIAALMPHLVRTQPMQVFNRYYRQENDEALFKYMQTSCMSAFAQKIFSQSPTSDTQLENHLRTDLLGRAKSEVIGVGKDTTYNTPLLMLKCAALDANAAINMVETAASYANNTAINELLRVVQSAAGRNIAQSDGLHMGSEFAADPSNSAVAHQLLRHLERGNDPIAIQDKFWYALALAYGYYGDRRLA